MQATAGDKFSGCGLLFFEINVNIEGKLLLKAGEMRAWMLAFDNIVNMTVDNAINTDSRDTAERGGAAPFSLADFTDANITFRNSDMLLYNNDCISQLRLLPSDSIDCIVTSPPYYGMRQYTEDDDREIGREDTLPGFISALVDVFNECKRVLKDDGTLWLNIGDNVSKGRRNHQEPAAGNVNMVPARLALALQEDGWVLLSDVIWHKTRVLPDGARMKPSHCYEHIFMFALDAGVHTYNLEDIRVPLAESSVKRIEADKPTNKGTMRVVGSNKPLHAVGSIEKGRNIRDVWSFGPSNVNGIHYATFPYELPYRCIKAGCAHDGIVLDPFSGSGMTGKAAIDLGRRYVGIELNSDYIDYSVNDVLADYTGGSLKESLFG